MASLIPYILPKSDIDSVSDIFLSFMPFIIDLNYNNPTIFSYDKIQTGNLSLIFNSINIKGIGLKIKALIARDLVFMFDINIDKTDYQFLFPVDTHVRQLCQFLWSEAKNFNDLKLIDFILEKCDNMKVSPLYFNHGLWSLGFFGRKPFEMLLELSKKKF